MDLIETLDLQEETTLSRLRDLKNKDFERISNTQITLSKKAGFKNKSMIRNPFRMLKTLSIPNFISYGLLIREEPINIADAKGQSKLDLIDMLSIEKMLEILKPHIRDQIEWIHLGDIQIIVKSTFSKNIDSPLSIAVKDDRINDSNDSIIGIVTGNLAAQQLKFQVHLGFAIPLQSESLETAITLVHKFYRENLMNEGQFPFSITYAFSYALTNSQHSIEFEDCDQIYFDRLFSKVLLKEVPRKRGRQSLEKFRKTKSLTQKEKDLPRATLKELPTEASTSHLPKPESELKMILQQVNNLSSYVQTHL